MGQIYLPSQGADDWQRLLAKPDRHWRPGYSAMEAALSWEAAGGHLPAPIAALFEPDVRLLLAFPEHKVALPGAGRDSQCDVFALLGSEKGLVALAVEAKVNESFGPLIGDWLAEGRGEGRRTRLAALSALLDCPLPPPDLRYQLFHRTAAAVLEARRFHAPRAAMVVQSFSPQDRWHEDFTRFAAFIGAPAARGALGSKVLPDGRQLTLGWAACAPSEDEHP